MLIAHNDEFQYVVRGTEINSETSALLQSGVTCPVCDKAVRHNTAAENPFESFIHEDSSPNCFESDREAIEHSRAVEAAFAVIHNRLAEITSEPVEIDIERRIGSSSKFLITDVRVTSPFKVTAEIFFKADDIGLRRRLSTLAKNDYRTWLIFHDDGVHDINRVQQYLQEVTSLSVGRYNSETLDVSLGGLFSSDKIDYSEAYYIPNYIIFTP